MQPLQRLQVLLSENRSDLAALLVYTLVTGLLNLAIPLSIQVLVNKIAQGIFLQPVLVPTFLLLLFMTIVGGLRLIQLSFVERLQQRVFARTALHLALNLPRIRHAAPTDLDVPERDWPVLLRKPGRAWPGQTTSFSDRRRSWRRLSRRKRNGAFWLPLRLVSS